MMTQYQRQLIRALARKAHPEWRSKPSEEIDQLVASHYNLDYKSATRQQLTLAIAHIRSKA